MATMHHPWREFREMTDWRLRWAGLPFGVWGETCFDTRTVTLTYGMSQAERRCTIAHETQHILRGPVPDYRLMKEELQVDRNVGRLLLPSVPRIIDSMVWARGDYEAAADDLWVDPFILEVRLSSLSPREREYLGRRMDEVLL